MRVSLLAPMAAFTLALAGCSGGDNGPEVPKSTAKGVTIQEARLVLPLVSGNPGAVYFNLVNEGEAPQKLMSVDVTGVEMTMVHETIDTGGVAKMQTAQNVVVPAQGSLAFEPGGKHVMVMGLSPDLKPNTRTVLTINFDTGDKASVELPVISQAAAAGK
ncbi:copper chaperone PCu(A)C [Novosphingobium sp. TH158]|uniref:copper chaperone PCu(A)C n=1 Tax=Novosphingobium sp. TH158 TaxID=2067455 RepID=UPI0013042450|nr:copper chaperone PCu(A)C [Novosphingobium sp. TH158]